MMKTVKTREFLRNFKELKGQLVSGRIEFVTIDIGDDRELELSVRHRKHTAAEIVRNLQSQPKPRAGFRRVRIFDELFDRKI